MGLATRPGLSFLLLLLLAPWVLYYFFRSTPTNQTIPFTSTDSISTSTFLQFSSSSNPSFTSSSSSSSFSILTSKLILPSYDELHPPSSSYPHHGIQFRKPPVLGPIPLNGTKPVYGKHRGTDAIFALACKYPVLFYQRFVGSLRKFGYKDDIVLAVSPPEQMKPGVEEYVKQTNVVAYAFDVDCAGKDNCRLKNDFLG